MSRNSFLNRRGKSEWIYISGKVCNTVLVDMIIFTDFLNITSMKTGFVFVIGVSSLAGFK